MTKFHKKFINRFFAKHPTNKLNPIYSEQKNKLENLAESTKNQERTETKAEKTIPLSISVLVWLSCVLFIYSFLPEISWTLWFCVVIVNTGRM